MPTLGQKTLIKLNGLYPKRRHENGMENVMKKGYRWRGRRRRGLWAVEAKTHSVNV